MIIKSITAGDIQAGAKEERKAFLYGGQPLAVEGFREKTGRNIFGTTPKNS